MISLARQSDHSESPDPEKPEAGSPAEPEAFVWPPPIEAYLAPVEVDPAASAPAPSRAEAVLARPAAPRTDADPPMPLVQVVAASASYDWQDGVLIALQVIDQLCPDGREPAGCFPDLAQIALSPTGFLLTQLDAPDREPLAGLGRLLRQLLGQTELPPTLRLLMMQSASARALLSFEGVARDLKAWDRSPRLPELADLYQRVRYERPVSRNSVHGTSHTALPSHEGSTRRTSGRHPLTRRVLLSAAATGVFVGSVAALYYVGARVPESLVAAPTELVANVDRPAVQPPPAGGMPLTGDAGDPPAVPPRASTPAVDPMPSRQTSPPVTAEAPAGPVRPLPTTSNPAPSLTPRGAPQPGPAAVSARVSPEPAPAPRPAPASLPVDLAQGRYSEPVLALAEEQFRRGRLLFEERQYVAAAAAFSEVAKTLERGDPALPLRVIATELAEASRALSSRVADASGNIYTSADADVTEPVSLAQLPPRVTQGTAPELIGVLELLIDTRGNVEGAHLVGADQHFRDRWLVSAAKSWRFEPAIRNGQPVRFLKRLTFRASGGSGPF